MRRKRVVLSLLVVFALLVASTTLTATIASARSCGGVDRTNQGVDLLNRYRAEHGAPALDRSENLDAIALPWAQHHRTFSPLHLEHRDINALGETIDAHVIAFFDRWGELLALTSECDYWISLQNQWENSTAGHAEAMRNPNYTHVGIAYHRSSVNPHVVYGVLVLIGVPQSR